MAIAPWKIQTGLIAFLLVGLLAGGLLLRDNSSRVGFDAFVLGMQDEIPGLENGLADIAVADAAAMARVRYEQGDVAAAADIFTRLDAMGRLDADGLKTLAFYQAEMQDFRAQHHTLARLVDHGLPETEVRRILGYFEAMGMGEDRLSLLERLAASGRLTVEQRVQLMRIYRHAGRSGEALELLRGLLSSDPGDIGTDEMRMLVRLMERVEETGARTTLLTNWIRTPRPPEEMRARLGLLSELGETRLLVEHAAPWRKDDPVVARLFDYGLYLLRDTPDHAGAYTERLLERLADPVNRGETLVPLVHEVFDRLPIDEAYSSLLATVPGDGDVIEAIYLDRLVRDGRRDDAGAIIEDDFAAEGPGYSDRLELAKQMVAIGAIDRAESAYRQMALNYGPTYSVLNGLRYVWKKQGKDPGIDWIGQQFLAAPAYREDDWQAAFLAAGPPAALLDWIEVHDRDVRPGRNIALTRVKLALWEEGAPRLGRELDRALSARALSDEDLAGFLQTACENGHASAASLALAALETRAGENPDGRLCLARLTPDTAPDRLALFRYKRAETSGATFTAHDLLRYAGATKRVMGAAAARPLYDAALAKLPPLQEADLEEAQLRGYVELECGNLDRAAEALQVALAHSGERPDAALLQALLQVHTDLGDYDAVLRLTRAHRDTGAGQRLASTHP